MGQFTSLKYIDKKETGILAMIFICLFISILIFLIYSFMIYFNKEEIIENDSFKFFFKKFIRKTALLFSVKL